jgi:hypothetical protein
MKQDIRNFVVECDVCQHNKGEIVKYLGTLQLLPIPPAMEGYLYGFYYQLTQIKK